MAEATDETSGSAGSDQWSRATAMMTARNERLLMRKAHPAPAAATSRPPMAGPTARATLKATELSATALATSSRGTRSGTIACHAGRLKATPTPSRSPRPRRIGGLSNSRKASSAIAEAAAPHHYLGHQDHLAPVEDVGERPGGEGEEEERERSRCRHGRHPERGPGELLHQPRCRHRLNERTGIGCHRSQPQRTERCVAERGD